MPEILPGSLSVVRPAASREGAFETFIKVAADGTVTAFNGHVDLGHRHPHRTGPDRRRRTRRVPCARDRVLGDTSRAAEPGRHHCQRNHPDHRGAAAQGAAQARHFLLARAAEKLELAVSELSIEDGLIRGRDNRSVKLRRVDCRRRHPPRTRRRCGGEGRRYLHHRRTVGAASRSSGQGDGELVYVHDMRVPGMLHAAWCARLMPASMPAILSAPA